MSADEFADVRPKIERLLSDSLRGSVRLFQIERITEAGRNNELLRCHLEIAPTGAPATVMVKRRRTFDPEAHDDSGTLGLYRNWAGLQFLTDVALEAGDTHAGAGPPRFYGGDRAHGIVAMEDLGTPYSLADVLLRGTAEEAERGLLLLASALGRMSAATVGREADYLRIRAALGPGDGPNRRASDADTLRTAAHTLAERCTELGSPPQAGYEADVDVVARAVADPGPFLAYTHGDPCPDNNTIIKSDAGSADAVLRLFDFDIGGFRHALSDGVYGRIRFPTCWCVRDIPESIVEWMETAYRTEFAKGCPAAADDTLYMRATVEACAAWIITTLGWSFERALERDGVWGEATYRQRILMRLTLFAQLAHRVGHLEALAGTAVGLHTVLHRLWAPSTAPISFYPAFTGFTSETTPARGRP